jgi:hypothetical protein
MWCIFPPIVISRAGLGNDGRWVVGLVWSGWLGSGRGSPWSGRDTFFGFWTCYYYYHGAGAGAGAPSFSPTDREDLGAGEWGHNKRETLEEARGRQ